MRVDRAACDSGFGPYTVLDLHDLPEDGKGFELEDGWLVEVAAGARHNFIAIGLGEVIKAAAASADVYVCLGGEWEFSTPSGIRKPDIAVVPRDLIRRAVSEEGPRILPGTEILLAVEVVSPGSGSERTDRVRKVREYATLGIPEYWIVEHQGSIRVRRLVLEGDAYLSHPVVEGGAEFHADIDADRAIPVSFDPAVLLDV
ncbi:Uma2 family endonuclease [Nocardia mangyaensis]|uniref:Uma2 family endonuclease n=1 Tax=Nocardia mangyaensis TaxID=2213200 RepID=UPI002674C740|nr:Uma2 family endonuclease [Nocardia mangyaensis]MDO3645975.1 Uma2 family endonuclease [Nocardia mangyaensis]